MQANVVEVQHLSRRFPRAQALDDVSFNLQPGNVYGLVGANGQGKTTLIKHLLGLLKAQQGSVRVFGMDPVKEPVKVLSRIGYLSENREMPDWMTIAELLSYTAAFHPRWDGDYAVELLNTFRLDRNKKIKDLSKGMRAQVGLIAAVGHRPDLLLLDEPSTGLDAIVRKDILNAIVRTVADEHRTVLFSSHLLDEVEQMSDYMLMMHAGRLILHDDLDSIHQQHARWVVRFANHRTAFPALEGLLLAEPSGSYWRVVTAGDEGRIANLLLAAGGEIGEVRSATLQEIFEARAGRQPEALRA